MLDAYCSIGMPLMYAHWSFGKLFVATRRSIARAIRRSPMKSSSIPIHASATLEENTMTMQALVLAHAAFGHNHFFKNNYLFRQWTDADGILDYLDFAKHYIAACEERYGDAAVEADARCRARPDGAGRLPLSPPAKPSRTAAREAPQRREHEEKTTTISGAPCPHASAARAAAERQEARQRKATLKLPEENLLYFLEKNSPSCTTGSANCCASCAISRNISIRSARPR